MDEADEMEDDMLGYMHSVIHMRAIALIKLPPLFETVVILLEIYEESTSFIFIQCELSPILVASYWVFILS